MTATTATAAAASLTAEQALPEPPFSPQLVEEFVRHFVRAVKTHQLYLPNNPIYQRSIDGLRTSFTPMWEVTTELVLQISESEFRWMGRSVHHEGSRSESLPWVFYKDGLRELTIMQGFEQDEVATLLDIMQRVRKASPDEDDLLTLLWEQEFAYLRYRFIDIGEGLGGDIMDAAEAAAAAANDPDHPAPVISVSDIRDDVAETERKGIVKLEELDGSLYFLDEHEIDYLREAVQKEQTLNLRRNVLTILFDIAETQPAPEARDEVCTILEQIMPHLLTAGDYGAVALLLREAAVVLTRAIDLSPAHRQRFAALPGLISNPAVLQQLLTALNDATTVPPQEDLDALFEQLQGETLGTILSGLKQTQRAELRTMLERTAARLASSNTAELLKLIAADDEQVAVEAMRRAADLKTPAAVGHLLKCLSHAAVPRRLGAVQALSEIGSPGALRALESSLDDADRDVRLTAVRTLSTRGHRAALAKVEAVVKGASLKDADLTEKMAYFEAYGLLAGDAGIAQLDGLLNGRSALLRLRVDPELRACAAMALGRIGTDKAFEVLRKAADDKDVRVRSAINKALRGGTQ
ncbi:MAG TPA: HEAT repeat domain-containing protein [Gemmatimonadaceae bacterium]